MTEGLEMAIEMAKLRGWYVKRHPIQIKPGYAGVTLTGGVQREAFYLVGVPYARGKVEWNVEIDDTPAGLAKLLGILVREGV